MSRTSNKKRIKQLHYWLYNELNYSKSKKRYKQKNKNHDRFHSIRIIYLKSNNC